MLKKQLLIALAFLLAGIAVDSGAAILCYSRDQSTGVANGTVDDCPSDLACYLYTKDKISYAGCGRCTEENTEDHNCESCTSDYCNDWPSLIGCFYAKSETKKENWLKISCNKKFCYSFNYTIGATYYAAGCGNCSGYEKFDTCRVCSTDYCNSATAFSADKLQFVAGGFIILILQSWIN
ncbi:hypothetical protein BOX15_Mlig005402g3 [Macrostomum lignano]|uniref:Uncharacterized protein n=2 Tax=Macrostomum lignano TaxID=282301 RepID=A0A1I8FEW2_9PLAT|nr:hypothetical protein BOX15_Mlig005402g3 [Macrostomum lignano]